MKFPPSPPTAFHAYDESKPHRFPPDNRHRINCLSWLASLACLLPLLCAHSASAQSPTKSDLAVHSLVSSALQSSDKAKPNILFIFSDDHAYQALSAYSDKLMQTPNIDRIAKAGMRFDRCYVTNSICGPMRAVIQTGKYSHKNGFIQNGNRFDGMQWTFPKALQKAGYQTAVVGKWHLGTHQSPQGFNYSEVLIGQGPYYNPPMFLNAKGTDDERVKTQNPGYTTDIITDKAIDWLKNGRDSEKPFMLMFQHKAPHREWLPGPEHLDTFANPDFPVPETYFEDYSKTVRARAQQEMTVANHMRPGPDMKIDWAPQNMNPQQREAFLAAFKEENEAYKAADLTDKEKALWNYQRYMRIYLASIRCLDDNIGRMLDYLKESGLEENTIVIYCSDQGFYLGEHGWYDKRWVYEESLRTPMLVKWPDHIAAGQVNSKDIVSPLDFAATFCEIAGAETPDDLDGRSLVPIFHGTTPEDWRKDFYYQYYEYPAVHMVRRHYAVVDGRYKLIHFYEPELDEWELIDLVADPLEQKNFYGQPKYKEVQDRLAKRLTELRQELEVPEDTRPSKRN